jgi:5-oxoprolinase (ATP-hydrolysing)
MPPFSKTIKEEGFAMKSLKIVKNNIFREEELVEKLLNPGEGIIGTRALKDNISDIKA